MALTPFTGTISATVLNDNFDDATSTIRSQATAGQKDNTVTLWLSSLASGAAQRLRSVVFTAQDDQEIRYLILRATADTGSLAISAQLTVEGADDDNGNARFLNNEDVSVAITTSVGTVDSRSSAQGSFIPSTGVKIRLLRGVQYRLEIINESGTAISGPLMAMLQTRSVRRRQ